MQPIRLLVLTAVVPEAKALLRGLRLTKVAAPVPFWEGSISSGGGELRIALAVVGIRANRLGALGEWLGETPIAGMIVAGLAGGLAPDVRLADVIIDPQNAPQRVANARVAPILCVKELVATPTEKQRLFTRTNCVAVEMETAKVREWANDRDIPVLAIRAISDAATDPLDPRLLSLVDPAGDVRLGRAVATLARHPSTLAAMLRLQKNSARAMANLGRMLDDLIASGWPVKNTEEGVIP